MATIIISFVTPDKNIQNAFACTNGDIIPKDFFENCRRVVERIQETAIARRIGHPDEKLLADRLAVCWVDFYIEHGEAPPPFLANIATSAWQFSMRKIGFAVRKLIEQQPGHDDGEPAILPLYTLAKPEARQTICNYMSEWATCPFLFFDGVQATETALLQQVITDEARTSIVASATQWLEKNVIKPVLSLRGFLAAEFPNSAERLTEFLEEIRRLWRPVLHGSNEEQSKLAQEVWPKLMKLINTERKYWCVQLFLQP